MSQTDPWGEKGTRATEPFWRCKDCQQIVDERGNVSWLPCLDHRIPPANPISGYKTYYPTNPDGVADILRRIPLCCSPAISGGGWTTPPFGRDELKLVTVERTWCTEHHKAIMVKASEKVLSGSKCLWDTGVPEKDAFSKVREWAALGKPDIRELCGQDIVFTKRIRLPLCEVHRKRYRQLKENLKKAKQRERKESVPT